MVKFGYHPLDIYLGQYILPFLVKELDFVSIGSKNEGSAPSPKRVQVLKIIEMSRKGSGLMVKVGYHSLDCKRHEH